VLCLQKRRTLIQFERLHADLTGDGPMPTALTAQNLVDNPGSRRATYEQLQARILRSSGVPEVFQRIDEPRAPRVKPWCFIEKYGDALAILGEGCDRIAQVAKRRVPG